ncbi:hypothetical protein LCGC14_1609760, partial [marine sediment metagenome]
KCPDCKKDKLGKVYNYYPEWYLEITGEDETKITISPTWNQIKQFIKDVKIHEMRIDKYRDRKDDADNWMKEITNASKELQTELSHFEEKNIPEEKIHREGKNKGNKYFQKIPKYRVNFNFLFNLPYSFVTFAFKYTFDITIKKYMITCSLFTIRAYYITSAIPTTFTF